MPPPVEVYDKLGRKVRAKILVDAAGGYVRDPMTGAPLIVDEDFDMDRAIAFARSLQTIPALNDNPDGAQRAAIYMGLIKAFLPSGPLDMQRSYNGMVGGGRNEFVGAFRPAASYLLGVVGRAAGLTSPEIMLGAGLQRLGAKQSYPYLDTSDHVQRSAKRTLDRRGDTGSRFRTVLQIDFRPARRNESASEWPTGSGRWLDHGWGTAAAAPGTAAHA